MANRPRLRVENTSGVGYKTKIFIDEQDVSECFSDVKVTAGVKGAVTVELEALVAECFIDGHMQLKLVGDGTRELLIKHGWMPPAEDEL